MTPIEWAGTALLAAMVVGAFVETPRALVGAVITLAILGVFWWVGETARFVLSGILLVGLLWCG